MQGDFQLLLSLLFHLHSCTSFFFFFSSGKAARFAEFSRPRTLSDTWFQLDIFLCFLVLACLGLLLSSLPLPSPPTPSLVNSPLLFPISLPMSSFSQSLSEYVALWTTVSCWRFLKAWHPVNDFKFWHSHKQPIRAAKPCGRKKGMAVGVRKPLLFCSKAVNIY